MSRRHSLIGASKPYLYKEEDAEFYYRQTSGGIIMNNSPLVGGIDKIKGQTIAWNQVLKDGNFAQGDLTYWMILRATATISNNIITVTKSESSTSGYIYKTLKGSEDKRYAIIVGHKYLVWGFVNSESPKIRIGVGSANLDIKGTGTWFNFKHILKPKSASGTSFVFMDNSDDGIYTTQWKELQVFNLTLIYGADNEPSTPEEFEADYQRWFGKPLTYEPYDAGSLRNVQMEGIKTTFTNASPQTRYFDVTSITGKLNGEGESVVIFPDGMKGVGDVKDEIYIEDEVPKAVKRIGSRAYQSGDESNSNVITDGTITYYELAEPQVYVLDTPLPIAYNCEAGGTEQILPEEVGTGIAPIMDITYKIGQINN